MSCSLRDAFRERYHFLTDCLSCSVIELLFPGARRQIGLIIVFPHFDLVLEYVVWNQYLRRNLLVRCRICIVFLKPCSDCHSFVDMSRNCTYWVRHHLLSYWTQKVFWNVVFFDCFPFILLIFLIFLFRINLDQNPNHLCKPKLNFSQTIKG